MRIVICSGYMNPVHVGHIDFLEAAKQLGNRLIVIVNNDKQVVLKGSKAFMSEEERCRIVSSLRCVDECVLSIDDDKTVLSTLKKIYAKYETDVFVDSITFANGGDRHVGNSPEEDYCKSVGIRTEYGVGGEKTQSSSSLLESV
jgi:cytidyltransferase-like protein